uniref:cytochrome b n=1 Tax=Cryptonema producta TaxID=870231 RepID=UPI00223872E3|nr:cytochrome b [Cryptonema producta]UYR95070.1 cytochrome b [Cryptonema producta]
MLTMNSFNKNGNKGLKTFVNWKKNKFTSSVGSAVYDLPTPANLNSMWNFGSLLIVCLMSQIVSGLLMAVHYTPEVGQAFESVIHIMRDVNGGWFFRSFHANGASFFFALLYLHISRGLYFHSFHLRGTWLCGWLILVLSMATAFTGYVLPWGQMSFWGATVITNLFSAIPYIGNSIMEWIWGGHCIGDASLKRFFVMHFLSPFIIMLLVGVHIIFLHETGSSNPAGVDTDGDVVPFHSYYLLKDLVGMVLMEWCLVLLCLLKPDLFLDPTNFMPADPMKTPVHIQPEWYFLFAYAILRSVPSKLGGVGALAASVFVLILPMFYPKSVFRGGSMNVMSQVIFFVFLGNFVVLTFIGMCPVEEPFITMGIYASVFYFSFFILYPLSWYVYEVHMGFKKSFDDSISEYNL